MLAADLRLSCQNMSCKSVLLLAQVPASISNTQQQIKRLEVSNRFEKNEGYRAFAANNRFLQQKRTRIAVMNSKVIGIPTASAIVVFEG